jgi:hypothetical protein
MTEHKAFLTQYVLNRCLGKDGTLEGHLVAESAEKAWNRIQEFSRADDQPEPFPAKDWQDRIDACAPPLNPALENVLAKLRYCVATHPDAMDGGYIFKSDGDNSLTMGDLRRWVESENRYSVGVDMASGQDRSVTQDVKPNHPPITVEPARMTYAELSEKYHELIMAVERKFPGESRHQTALRYIRRMEEPATTASQESEKVTNG